MLTPLAIDGKSQVYGLMGSSVSHSLSPAIQNAAFAAAKFNGVYVTFTTEAYQLAAAVRGLAAAGISGFNLTAPHKTAVLPLVDELSPQAQAIAAVNTIHCQTVNGRMHLLGHNTDGLGLLDSLVESLDFHPQGKRILLLGAGGSARSIAFILLAKGCRQLWIANRTPAHAAALVRSLQAHFTEQKDHIAALPLLQISGLSTDLLLNTTSLGTHSPVNLADLEVTEAVADILYSPWQTPLLKQAQQQGLKFTNGIGMLLHQGAHAFHFWTQQPAPLQAMRQALNTALGRDCFPHTKA